MKLSEVTIQNLKDYAREYNNDQPTNDAFTLILTAGKLFISNYTGLPLVGDPANGITGCDDFEDLTIVLFVLANEMYDNRTFTVDSDKINPVIKSILDMHSINLL
jgi:hypothetical protein